MVNKISPKTPSPSQNFARLLALLGLLLLIFSGIIYIINQNTSVYAQIGTGIGLALLLGAALLRPEAIRTFLAGRPVKYASHAIVKSMAFFGLLVLINLLAIKYGWEIDLTETGQFTLSPETIHFLTQLDRPVEVIGFFQYGDPRLRMAEDYLARYSQHTEFLTYEFYSPNLNPKLAKRYNLHKYGLVFVSGNNHHQESAVDEQSITQAVARVANMTDSVPISPPKTDQRHVWLTPTQASITVFTTLIIIPLVVLLAGVIVWWKRR